MHAMTNRIGFLVAMLATACAPSPAKRSTAPLDDVLRAAVEQRRVPAVVAMVATGDGVAYQGAFGVGKDGIFSIASMTKPVTSVEKGRGAGTLSWAGIFNTFFWIDRDKKVCAVLMTQLLPFLDDGSKALVDDFDRAVYAWRDGEAR